MGPDLTASDDKFLDCRTRAGSRRGEPFRRSHGRACPGHPCLLKGKHPRQTWMPATSAGMTPARSIAIKAPGGCAPWAGSEFPDLNNWLEQLCYMVNLLSMPSPLPTFTPASGGKGGGTCEFAEELPLASPDLSSSAGREFVVSQKTIAVLSSTAGRGKQARGKLEFMAAAASLGLGFLSGISTPAAASHHRHHGAYAMGDLGYPWRGWHRSHRRTGSDETTAARKPGPAKQPSGPLLLAISTGSQRVTV